MIRRTCRDRSGITLTEILISIMIMGIGIVSLATLFPLGLLRLRDAARSSRSGILSESAAGDLGARNLLSQSSFTNRMTSPWNFVPVPYDPWIQDTPSYGASPFGPAYGAYRGQAPGGSGLAYQAGPGLPVAYDPLWRTTTGIYLDPVNAKVPEARFATGIGSLRNDPAGGLPSAHGLQRLTNFPPPNPANLPWTMSLPDFSGVVNEIFVSPEDVVLQSDTDSGKPIGSVSPIVPDLALGKNTATNLPTPQYDWKYTWMFTGQQADTTNGTVFVGDIVVFENRPFSVDAATSYFTSTNPAGVAWSVAGEPVVEAIFGYTNNVTTPGGKVGYGSSANRAVLLRWPASMPDIEVKVGSWIADVTYERNATEDFQRSVKDPSAPAVIPGGLGPVGAFYPYQRCYWYQVAKRTQAGPAANSFTGDASGGMREMTVWTSTPLRAFTLLQATGANAGAPYHVNAALVSPYVVNVFPRTIYTR
jgi:hypothetical protein